MIFKYLFLALISTTIRMAEVVGNLYEERPNYTFNELAKDF